MYATLLAVPVVLSRQPGWSAGDAGLALAMMSVAMVAVSPFGGRLADRLGYRLPGRRGPRAADRVDRGAGRDGRRPVRRRPRGRAADRGRRARARGRAAAGRRHAVRRRPRRRRRRRACSRPGATWAASSRPACSPRCSAAAPGTRPRCSRSPPSAALAATVLALRLGGKGERHALHAVDDAGDHRHRLAQRQAGRAGQELAEDAA